MSKTLWVIDPVHSEITFKVRHMMITNVGGCFDHFEAKMRSSADDFSDAEMSFEASIDSVNTRNENRDTHLKSADFFDAENHPKLSFVSSKLTKKDQNQYTLEGDITIRGVQKKIELQAEYLGSVIDPWGQVKAGFEISGTIVRTEFGLNWNTALEEGGVALSESVMLKITVQMIKQI
jgi:polyisoprenoid-binding protein YceI